MEVAIFGAGLTGRYAFEQLTKQGYRVVCFYDNDKNKHGQTIEGRPIFDPKLIDDNSPRILIPQMSKGISKQIENQIKELNFSNFSHIGINGIEKLFYEWDSNRVHSKNGMEFFQENTPIPERKWKIPSWLSNCNESWAKQLRDVYHNPVSFPASLSPAAGELYRSLILNIAPKTIIEIGIFMGVSTLWAASALNDLDNDGNVISIDLFENKNISDDHLGYVSDVIYNAGFSDSVKLLKLNSNLDSNEVKNVLSGKKVDFLFIDGDHTPLGASTDFKEYSKFLSIGGYILFHDVFPEYCGWDGPAYVIDNYIKNSNSFEICQIYTTPNNYGMALIRKISDD